jgi:hypothetical protein
MWFQLLAPCALGQKTVPSGAGKAPRLGRPVASNPCVQVIRATNGLAYS